ncbi:MAG: ATP-binding protein [Erysipelotrichaceae bacterium]
MEKVEFKFKLSEEQQKLKEERFHSLIKNKYVKKLLKDYAIDEQSVYNNTGRISEWLVQVEKCRLCTGLECCTQPQSGIVLDLSYDHGFVNEIKKCNFAKAEEKALAHVKNYKRHDLSDELLKVNITNIDLSDEPKAYKSNVLKVLEFLEKPEKGLFLYGAPGVGKTYLAACITNKFAKDNKSVAFIHMPTFMSDIKLMLNDKYLMDKTLNIVKNVDVLVMDDIGGESVTSWGKDEIILPILNERMEKKRLCVFTSNYDFEKIQEHYTYTSRGNMETISALRLVERMKAVSIPLEIRSSNRRM